MQLLEYVEKALKIYDARGSKFNTHYIDMMILSFNDRMIKMAVYSHIKQYPV